MKNLLLFSLLLLGLSACNKDKGAIPDTNAQGEYFNCKIDGKYWTYKQADFTSRKAITAERAILTAPGFRIRGDNVVDFPHTIVTFWLTGVDFPDKDTVDLTTYGEGAYAEVVGPNLDFANLDFQTDTVRNGKLIFTSRTPQRLEGTFYFDAYRKAGAPIVHITEGRFSIIP